MRKEGVDYEWMLVSNKEESFDEKRMVITTLPEESLYSVVAVTRCEENKFLNGNKYGVTLWRFAKPIPKAIFTNSIGQEWFDEDDESTVYYLNKRNIKLCSKPFCDAPEPYSGDAKNYTEIFKTKEDVENYVVKYINRR